LNSKVGARCPYCKAKGRIKTRFSWKIGFIPGYLLLSEIIGGLLLATMSPKGVEGMVFGAATMLIIITIIFGIPFSFIYWLLTRNKQKCEACGLNIN